MFLVVFRGSGVVVRVWFAGGGVGTGESSWGLGFFCGGGEEALGWVGSLSCLRLLVGVVISFDGDWGRGVAGSASFLLGATLGVVAFGREGTVGGCITSSSEGTRAFLRPGLFLGASFSASSRLALGDEDLKPSALIRSSFSAATVQLVLDLKQDGSTYRAVCSPGVGLGRAFRLFLSTRQLPSW